MVLVRSKVLGAKKARARLDQLSKLYPAAFRVAVYREALKIFVTSQIRVPVDTGRLRSSGGVSPPSTGGVAIVTIYYGAVYAGIVHEKHPTRAKFLEGPFLEALPGLPQRIEAETLKLAGRSNSPPPLPPAPPKAPAAPRERDAAGRYKKRGT